MADQQSCKKKVDKKSFWSVMVDESMHRHLKREAYKVADLIAQDSANRRTTKYKLDDGTPGEGVEQNFWTLMEDEAIHAHLRQEAFKVAEMITRGKGPSLKTVEVKSLAEVSIPLPSFTSSPPTTDKPSKQTSPKTDEDKHRLKPCPELSLGKIFKLLSSDEWQQKMLGLTSIQDLLQNHPEVVKATLRKVCVVVIKEVKNPRSMVSCAAIATLGEMYAHLKRTMNDFVEETGQALILKVSESNKFIQQKANLALDAMVQNCSPSYTIKALSAGLGHGSTAARVSAALHLRQLCHILGATQTLTGGKNFTKHFLMAVSKICVDAAVAVRRHGHDIVQNISSHSAFRKQWQEAVPEKERRLLEGLVNKLQKQQKRPVAQDCDNVTVDDNCQ
ncbi:hypothetical protein CgunFtcFv8_025784 [Champsocephalus gunnari]|uniref:TOG domain-containing protein n=1 Tax=Champsocephalus gunnari TaxID=52237 RepID=A0AAN8H374_CHAGU|nr:hypothetical protein CgunFtcFv8_025784 [Champsocephalus gunnari]